MSFWHFIIAIVFIGVVADWTKSMYKLRLKHKQETEKIKLQTVQEELKLEQIKHDNYLLETEKMRLELQKMLEVKDDQKL